VKVHIIETLASGAPYVAPILVARLDALREKPDDAHSLAMLGVSVKIAIRAGEHVGDPPDGARIDMQALDGSAVFPVFHGTLRVEPIDAFSCRLVLAAATAFRSALSGRLPIARFSPEPRNVVYAHC